MPHDNGVASPVIIRRTKHHVITRNFLNKHNLRLKRGNKIPIPDYLHVAYHTVFGGICSWSAVKKLKIWAKQLRQNQSPHFYETFTMKQLVAFQTLFGFKPVALGNGCLTRAIRFIQNSGFFYPDQAIMAELRHKIKKKKK